ncbi:sulfite exporter TauE/SafE family protein [Chloroflexota bacterium]
MTEIHIIILLATGFAVGFASGLLGVGGAFIMAPVQYQVFLDMGLAADLAIKLAFGTNLLVILVTATSGAWRHTTKGSVWWRAAIIMGIPGAVAAFLAAMLATKLPGKALEIAFGVVVLLGGIRMLFPGSPDAGQTAKDNPWLWFAWAIPMGLVAGFTGIGGGVLAIPVMVMVFRFKMHEAVGTSLGVIIFTSVGGVAGYILGGWSVPNLLPGSIGYVNLISWLLLAVSSVGIAQVGALTAHKLPARQLRYIFIILMFFVAFRMLGVFGWLGLTI